MRPATEEEIKRIEQLSPGTTPTAVLSALIQHPYGWFHVGLNESGHRGNLREQCEVLEEEATRHGYEVRTKVIPGHRDGGFFAVLTGRTRTPV